MRKIVVGFGTHDHSNRALEWAAVLAARAGADVIVLNVFHQAYAEMSPDVHAELVAARRNQISRIMQESGHERFEVVIRSGEALDELVRFSEDLAADLIVVGRHESMGPGGLGEGGAAEELLRKSRIPFVVVHDSAPLPIANEPMTIIVGVDGTSANAESVDGIARLAADLGARTVPVLSVNTGVSTTRQLAGAHLLHQDEAEAIAKRLPNSESIEILNESPVQGLIDAATDWNADLIAIGTRGHRSFTDLFSGQISRHVIDHATTGVLIAPHH